MINIQYIYKNEMKVKKIRANYFKKKIINTMTDLFFYTKIELIAIICTNQQLFVCVCVRKCFRNYYV